MSRKQEIEHKFLVDSSRLPPLPPGSRLTQGYLSFRPTVRVRTEEREDGSGRMAYLTIKGEGDVGRDEFEYEIPFEEATGLLGMCQGSVITKTRYRLPIDGCPELAWELDIFVGDNEGLVVAELEVPEEGCAFARPDWLGEDVTRDSRYKNAALAERPYREWSEDKDGGG